ncbi:CHAT domain-containing tetratricopeptide repeat protein [Sphaerisporangium sp. TRM90804]|uniref:CHAT domain-containing protein n=1 Tax=Sphaerisporangium sp. TRM90804 TaxID=3031113 RepID=UPI002447996B|nr:CHAT domain-containing tetratricopeptide repeat protein [Sphaerisporangium sp. TRM90804]MDH2427357.1 CHAT domain-containing tetratricopeptide repeat protein [Sphaerisporangium sp. TRM90804]
MGGGSAPVRERAGSAADLLPMVFARPAEALARARALLSSAPPPHDASVAHQVIGIWERDFGDLTVAIGHLRRARSLARRSGSPDREADALAALGVAVVHAGRTAEGLACLDAAAVRGDSLTAARVLFRRGRVLWILGRHREALDDLRRAVPVLRAAGDTIWTARALTLRGLVHLSFGAIEQVDLDFSAAERLWELTEQDHDRVLAVWNRGSVAYRAGDLPAALRHYDEVAIRLGALGTPALALYIDRCAVLLAAGLAEEALQEADRAAALIDQTRGQATVKAELVLVAAQSAMAAGDPGTAVARALTALRLFTSQRRGWWEAHARLVLFQARVAGGRVSGRMVGDIAVLAARLARLGSPETVQASLLAGRAALALGWASDADRHLAAAASGRHRGPAPARADGWLAEALRAAAAGRARTVFHACRSGLDALDEHRLTLGASELRARATAQGAELAAVAQRAALRSGDPRRLLVWSERWRATALAVPPSRPPVDQDVLRDTTAYREITGRVEAARSEGRPAPALEREQRRLERAIRARTLRSRGEGTAEGRPFDPRALLEELGDGWLVEIVDVDGDVHVLLCGRGRVRRFQAGRVADAAGEIEHLRAGLRRLAYEPAPAGPAARPSGPAAARLLALEAGARRLQETLLGPAVRHLGPGAVVMVPPGRLHGVPWAALPALRDRVLGVSPSARAWLRAKRVPAPAGGGVVLVRGPGLATGGGEVPSLAGAYPAATVLRDGTATVSAVLAAVDGAPLAHIAAHGDFRADSPMFSSLRMDDGRLTVHDVEGLGRAPYRIVLPSCDSGRLAPVGADELLGLAAALLPLGTAGIVASLVPVSDEAVVPLMLSLHDGLRAGLGMAEALRDARRALPGDPGHQATGWSFTAIGAA